MNTTKQTTLLKGDKRVHTNRQTTTGVAAPRTIAMVTGVFFVITYITAILAVMLYGPLLNDPNYIIGAGADTPVLWGALLEVILVIANIGTAVTLFSILKRQNEGLALGYVAARIVESIVIAVGIISLLAVVTFAGLITGASVMGTLFALGSATTDLMTGRPEAVAAGMQLTFAVAAVLILVALAIASGSHALWRRAVDPNPA